MNKFAKMLLTATSLAPVLLVMAIDSFSQKGVTYFPFALLIIASALVVIALGLMNVARKGQQQELTVCKAKNSDKQTLTFLVAYLLPVLNDHKYLFRDFNAPTLAILALLAVAVYHSNSFDFNPLLGMFGYHFYEVEGPDGFPCLLISRVALANPCQTMNVRQIFDHTFLHAKDS